MILRLKVKDGIRKNDEFSIKGEVYIGRSHSLTDLTFNDHKVSGRHAKISINENNRFQIEDLDSSNGTFVNSAKITGPIELQVGSTIGIGRILIEVIEITGESLFEKGSWQAIVDEALIMAQSFHEKIPPAKSDFGVFKKPVRLEITKGDNVGKSFTFGFGPRRVGRWSAEAPVLSPDFPETAFEIRAQNGKCELFTKMKNVKVNSQPAHSIILKEGDLISVGQTEFLVKFVDPS